MFLKPGDTIMVGDHDDYVKTTALLREHGVETKPHETDEHVIVVTSVQKGEDNGRFEG